MPTEDIQVTTSTRITIRGQAFDLTAEEVLKLRDALNAVHPPPPHYIPYVPSESSGKWTTPWTGDTPWTVKYPVGTECVVKP